MYGTRATRAKVPYYRCSKPDNGCGVTSIQAEKMGTYVAAECEAHHDDEPQAPAPDADEREMELHGQLVEVEARAANVRRDYAEGAIDARTLKEALSTVEGRAVAIRRSLADEARNRPRYEELAEPVEFDEERAHYQSMIERIEVRKTNRNPQMPASERVSIVWRS
jgi:hypothetical protein